MPIQKAKGDGINLPTSMIRAVTKVPLKKVPRQLNDIPKAPPYRRIDLALSEPQQRGQRKRLLSEVGFLTRYGHLSNEVIYAGAAPGTHISYLARLFPRHRFTLYDTGKFHLRSLKSKKDSAIRKRIKTFSRYFTA